MVWEILGILFAWTWPIWAFVFVFCLAAAISRAVQEAGDGKSRGSGWYAFGAALALAVILGGLEASLRRFAHYDYWLDTVLPSIAEDSGADALLHVTPYYNKASQTGLIKHYEYIAERIELPMILYNVPSRTGVSFTAESYKVLAQNPKINGVKEASGNFSLLAHTRFLCPDDFYIWSGNDDQVVPMMSLGAKGVISVASNIIPEVMVKMSHLCLEGQFEDASKLQIAYMDLIDALFIEVNPIPIKAAMNLMGMEAGSLRLPLCDISHKNLETLRQAMGRMGLL